MSKNEDLISAIKDISLGRSLLFLGSGFSHNCQNSLGDNLPLAGTLAGILSKAINEDPETDLDIIADIYTSQSKTNDLYSVIKQHCTASAIPSEIENILLYPWRSIYTTNYDNVIEATFDKHKTPYRTYNRNNTIPDKFNTSIECVFLNGNLSATNRNNFLEYIHITNTQYFTTELAKSSWAAKFRADMSTARNVFFVGYSLYDVDIAKIIFDQHISGANIFFIQSETLSNAAKNKLSRFGDVNNIGVEAFSDLLDKHFVPFEGATPQQFLVNFRETDDISSALSEPDAKEIRELIVEGNISPKFLIRNISTKEYTYGIQRDLISEALLAFNDGEKNFLIKADIGNGKNFFAEDFLMRIKQMNTRVFFYELQSNNLEEDIAFFREVDDKVVVYFSDAYANSNSIRILRASLPEAIIVAGSRSAIHELHKFEVESPFGNLPFDIDLDSLTNNEVRRIIPYFKIAGLWGSRQGSTPNRLTHFINSDCNKTWRGIILSTFDQPSVQKRLSEFVSKFQKNKDLSDSFFRLSILSSTGMNLSFLMLRELLGIEVVLSRFRSESVTRLSCFLFECNGAYSS